ncbi:Golgi apparatus protein 1-like [Liolophura sinensis]|uniref:Golgi apparatus protein 1-like n=1 Tax=Liolophura sinensis TaxID=3198878 RepID=UPI0031593D3B
MSAYGFVLLYLLAPTLLQPPAVIGLQHQQQLHLSKGSFVSIAESPECRRDVKKLCASSIAQNNLGLIECLQNEVKPNEVTLECQHFLWQYKRNLTADIRFESASWEVCKHDLEMLEECRELEPGEGQIIPCLMENQHNISGQHCRQFLVKMESIVFSDYRLLKPLLDSCHTDIVATKCGRFGSPLQAEQEAQLRSHGAVIGCLEDNIKYLNGSCRFQMMRIAELQADDYHLDRPLFYACRDDRERLCPETPSGGGRIYQCLFRHKFERDMSEECRQRLIIRQRLIGENYKADKTLSDACDEDIKQYKCLGGGPNLMFAKRAAILLCLEGVQKTGGHVAGKCVAEMTEWRKSLMSDYQISLEIVVDCQNEIGTLCDGLGAGGKTLHCLMSKARRKPGERHDHVLGEICMRAIEDLLKEADVGEDFRIDQSLVEACSDSVIKYCGDIPAGDARVMGCLMEKLEKDILDNDDECAEHLLEIQYFVARDFKLDHRVYKHCHKDAARLCGAQDKWVVQGSTDLDPGPLVLPCLYRHIVHHDKVERSCRNEVKRVMRTRAMSINLMPEIEEQCIQDLGQFCSEGTGQGEELRCLQDRYDELTGDCQEAVSNFTEAEDADINLDVILMRACMPMIKIFCQDMLDEEDEEDIMECLIENKNHAEMNGKCAAGIEHHQLTSLKDFRFNHKFKENCKTSVLTYCKDKKTKYNVVSCLSEIVRNDTLFEEKHRITKPCRRQLRFELLQRSENIELDPDLKKVCQRDKEEFCDHIEPGRAKVIECLKKHQKKLTKPCKKLLFVREEVEVKEGADYALMNNCKKMIKVYCPHSEPHQILHCLKQHQTEDDFDQICHRTVIERQIMQNKDYRLNPQLQEACTQDVPKFCRSALAKTPSDLMRGKVIACLKKQFKINRLSQRCEKYIREVIHDAALDYRQDPVLANACKDTIKEQCADALVQQPDNKVNEAVPDEKGAVEECLKKLFKQKKIKEDVCAVEVSRIIAEGQIDVHVDPLLHSACVVDIRRHCSDVQPGQGQVMSCLLSLLEDNVRMTPACREKLQQRKEMWKLVAKVASPESFKEIMEGNSTSSAIIYYTWCVFMTMVVVGVMLCFLWKAKRRVYSLL